MKRYFLKRCLTGALAALLAASLAAPVLATEQTDEEITNPLTILYSSEEFEAQYTYTGNDLGATYTKEQTALRVWAPTALDVAVRLYKQGDPEADPMPYEEVYMEPDVNGTWIATLEGDMNGVYYTYLVTLEDTVNEACDPYARTTGVNGKRSMIIDLDSTNPEGWAEDKDPHYDNAITDAIIYELHVRDLSVDESSGITHKGKYLGLIETDTTNPNGVPTGLDHIKNLGITHIHLLPSYDYGSVDESKLDEPQFNWGYDPVNYNVPEGSYSTDPYNGEVRVREFKEMVKVLHDNDISVIMDVVYNHVYHADAFSFNQIVPQYFTRVSKRGAVSAGSGCGNDNATERSMVKKYIVDSVKYWADEYHIDGFRFDLVGLIDTETINAVIEEVHKTHPNVIFYGEGWNMSTTLTKEGYTLTTQANSQEVPKFAFFNDTLRDGLRGPMSNDSKPGFISGGTAYAGNVDDCIIGAAPWCKSPTQTINYASCHDNLALFDRILTATKNRTFEEQVKMNNLAAAVVLTSQGVPFFQAGEEMLRSKPLPEGGYDHNSYRSPDSINNLKWNDLDNEAYQQVVNYYTGLIAFRKAHPALRMTSAEAVASNMTKVKGTDTGVIAFQYAPNANGETNGGIFSVYNGRSSETTVALPEGEWTIYVQGASAGTKALGTASGSITVDSLSTTILVLENADSNDADSNTATDTGSNNDNGSGNNSSTLWVIVGFCAGLALVAGITVVIIKLRKRKKQ
ncbi:MAG: type I pullulanase [Oscillospiraceae bacterium]|nr:type I pullulanase [Oscillospiraceae bacterium]